MLFVYTFLNINIIYEVVRILTKMIFNLDFKRSDERIDLTEMYFFKSVITVRIVDFV